MYNTMNNCFFGSIEIKLNVNYSLELVNNIKGETASIATLEPKEVLEMLTMYKEKLSKNKENIAEK